MTWQSDDTDVVGQVLAAELCAEAYLVSLYEELVLQVDVTESTTCLIACCRQLVVILDGSQLHGQEVLLRRSTTDNEGDVVRRTSRRAEALHLLYEEREECALVLDSSLCHRVKVSLVGRTTTLGNHHEAILVALCSLDIDLCREVATSVHLIIHVKRCVLRITEVVLCVSVIDTAAQSLFVLEVGPYTLTLLAVDDSGTSVLAEWEDALYGSLGVAKELESHVLVVLRSLWVFQNLCHLEVVLTTEHELHVVKTLLREQGQGLLGNLEDSLTLKLSRAYAFLGKQAILSLVLSKLEHWSVLKIYWFSHNIKCLLYNIICCLSNSCRFYV